MEIFGWISATLFMFCTIPELIRCYKRGYCDISWIMIFMWCLGEIMGIIYAISLMAFPLIVNYFMCFILTAPLAYWRWKKDKYF